MGLPSGAGVKVMDLMSRGLAESAGEVSIARGLGFGVDVGAAEFYIGGRRLGGALELFVAEGEFDFAGCGGTEMGFHLVHAPAGGFVG